MDAHITITRERQFLPTAGAGILLYMARQTAAGMEISFVLAQEDFVNGWNQSGCWSAFEGGTRPGETSIDTAAREFVEETLGAVPINGASGFHAIRHLLEHGGYSMRICVERRDIQSACRAHVTYAIRIPWDTPVKAMFDRIHGPIRTLHERCTSAAHADARFRAQNSHVDTRKIRDAKIEAARRFYQSLPENLKTHPAIMRHQGTPTGLAIRPEYIEKRRVSVVSAKTLQAVLMSRAKYTRGHGRPAHSNVRLRYSFVPVLKTLLSELNSEMSRCRPDTRPIRSRDQPASDRECNGSAPH